MPPQPIFAQPPRSPLLFGFWPGVRPGLLPRPLPLLLTLALHAALLWWLNQSWPVAGAIRYVVFQVLQPSERDARQSSRAITLLQKSSAAITNNAPTRELPVLGAKPEKSTPLQTTQQLPQPSAQVAEPVPVPAPEPAVPLRELAPPPKPLPPPAMNKPVPEPTVAAKPQSVPDLQPAAQVAPAPLAIAPAIALSEPAAATKPVAQAAPNPAPPPAPVPAAAPVAPPVPAPSPTAPATQPTPAPQRLQAPPREVEVTASQPAPAGAVVSVVPVAPRLAPGGGAAFNGPGGAAGPGLGVGVGGAQGLAAGLAGLAGPLPNASAASVGTASPAPRPINLGLPPGPYRSPAPRRSLAEMANEQLRQGQPDKDPLAEGMARGGKTDCLRSGGQGALGGLLAAPVLVARALSGDCPK